MPVASETSAAELETLQLAGGCTSWRKKNLLIVVIYGDTEISKMLNTPH